MAITADANNARQTTAASDALDLKRRTPVMVNLPSVEIDDLSGREQRCDDRIRLEFHGFWWAFGNEIGRDAEI
ncbi:MAG: hypothetical protein ABI821_06335 [Pseudomonadota bacterium]